MIKRDELANPASCINKADDDEPVFVLRAQDALAPDIVWEWVKQAELHGVPPEKVREAERLASDMEAWQRTHVAKVPD